MREPITVDLSDIDRQRLVAIVTDAGGQFSTTPVPMDQEPTHKVIATVKSGHDVLDSIR